jgi:hypothetical protein
VLLKLTGHCYAPEQSDDLMLLLKSKKKQEKIVIFLTEFCNIEKQAYEEINKS